MKDYVENVTIPVVYRSGRYPSFNSDGSAAVRVLDLDVQLDSTKPTKPLRPTAHRFIKYTSNADPWVITWHYSHTGGKLYTSSFQAPSPAVGTSYPLVGPMTASHLQSLRNLAYNGAYNKLVERLRGELDVSIDLAEFKSTRALVASFATARGLTENLQRRLRLLRRDPSGTKAAADAYLEFMLGIKPLMNTIYGVYSKLMDRQSRGLHFRGRSRQVEKFALLVNWSPPTGEFSTVVAAKREFSYSIRCQIDVWLKNTDQTAAQRLAGWTSINPVSIAWELTRLSFVADWFYDVGSYIRQLETFALYQRDFDYGCVTFTDQVICLTDATTRNGVHTSYREPRNWILTGSARRERHARKDREVLLSFPVPRPPVLHLDLGSGQLVTLAALIRAAFRR